MKNLIYSLGKQSMLPILAVILFLSCKKDDSSVDEMRYRRYWQKKTVTKPVKTDTTKTTTPPATGTGTSTGTGTGTGTTGTGTTGTGTTGGTTTGTGTSTSTQATSADPTSTPTMFNDFESNVTAGFNSYIQQATAGLVSLSTDQHVSGSKSAKFTVIQSLVLGGGDSHSQLTKIDKEDIKEGTEKWYSNDYYFPSGFPTDIQIVRQWHHNANNYSPPAALVTNNGKLQWDQFTQYGDNGKDVFTDIAAYPLNKWFHVTIHIKFSSKAGTALNEVWIDGVKKMSTTATNMYPGITNVAMFGLYKWIYKISGFSLFSTATMYADNYKEW